MKLKLMFLCCLIILFNHATIQANDCPQIPDGIYRIVDLEWAKENEVVRLSIGFGEYESPHKRTWLDWNVHTNELEAVIPDGLVETTLAVGMLESGESKIEGQVVYPFENYIELSPNRNRAIYIVRLRQEENIIYAIDNIQSNITYDEIQNISVHIPTDVMWITDNQALIVTDYPSYDFLLFCFDGSCFEDLNILASENNLPSISPAKDKIAFVAVGSANTIVIYNPSTLNIEQSIELEYRFSSNNLLWSSDGNSLYFIGRPEDRGVDFGVYNLNLENGEVTKILQQIDYFYGKDWLIDPINRFIITGGFIPKVVCY